MFNLHSPRVNKSYVDSNYLSRNGGVLLGPLSVNRNHLIGIPDTPQFGYSAVNRNYVQSELAKIPSVDTSKYIQKSGDTMTGDLILQSQP